MTVSTGLQVNHERSPRRFDIAPPAWVRDWTAADAVTRSVGGLKLTIAQGPSASLVAATVPDAAALAADQFEQRTSEVYRALRSTLAMLPHRAPVRFWNYLPGIHEPMDERRDRYMVFNAGRFAAMCDWFGGPGHLPGRLPAASGVGHSGDELVVHCLACGQAGQAIENPRQVPAFRYSRRYGPRPPCFSRATVVTHPNNGSRALLVAGTASILGEQTVHVRDLGRQLDETLANLRALLAAAQETFNELSAGTFDKLSAGTFDKLGAGTFDKLGAGTFDKLGAGAPKRWGFTDIRAYHARRRDAATIKRLVGQALGQEVKVQMVLADLCRKDLLVEIEGLATLQGWGTP